MAANPTFSSQSPLEFSTRIDWSEVDAYGHVNNLAILRYVQSARVHALEVLGIMAHHQATGIGPVLAKTSCQFRKQLHYPGSVTVRLRIDHLKTTSFQMNHEVRDAAGELIAEAHDVLVFLDFGRNQKTPIPAPFREGFLALGAGEAL